MDVLEPSAGTGALLEALSQPDVALIGVLTAVEIRPDLRPCLGRAERIHIGDFLECTPERLGTFDRIVMNPPFEKEADIEHVTHALRFLKPDGRLVAIMSAGVTFRQDRRTANFRRLLDERGGTIEPLPDDSFKESGTNVRTVLVIIDGTDG